MQETTFEKELSLAGNDGQAPVFVIGVDEAGRGPLAGPVVAAAVWYKQADFTIPENLAKDFALIRDSKKLSEKQREKMFDVIQEHFSVGVGIVNAETIDRVNILQATFLAMRSAISELRRIMNQESGIMKENAMYLLVDGNQEIPNCSYAQEAVISGDGIVKSIAAASIIAKVARDRIIEAYDTEYPGYGFAKHKGYGTKLHMDALRHLGPCPIHRMSFKPVLLALPENVNKRFANVLKQKKR
ncbi:MAG: ribonuclease HII [Candidatus Moranbacteria bacterium RIFCSPHIGHO2_01_FULL_54_31]|nr:MAG: ribonuclease HII [Candidatus Moranbacteria bacterium RIFCSPHIGHO2_01_FULL_54_31]